MTYRACADYVFRSDQDIAVLENMTKLEEKGDEQASDAEFTVQDFKQHGHSCLAVKSDAADYGSWPRRQRLYFVVWKGDAGLNKARLRQMQAWMACVAVGQIGRAHV